MSARWRTAQFFELLWWRQYLARKRKADYLNWKKNYWTRLFDRFALWPPAGASVLDAGCGPAGAFLVLDNCSVDAVDPLIKAYERRLRHFSRQDNPQVCFINAPLEKFKAARHYDRVFCFNALNHVGDLNLCILRLEQCLAQEGILVCSIDVHRRGWLRRIFQRLPGDMLHPQQLTIVEYERRFELSGLECYERQVLKKGLIFNYILMKLRHRAENRGGHSS